LIAPVVIAFAAALGSTDVRARVVWDAPPACPDAAEVDARVRERVGTIPPDLTARATITSNAAGDFAMTVVLHDAASVSNRTLRAEDCRTLADAFALLVAVAAGADPPIVEPTPPPAFTGEVAVAGHVEWGALPRVTGGAALGGFVLGPRFRAGLELAYAAPRELPIAVTLQRYEVTALAGPALRRRWGDLSIALGVTAGGFVATSRGDLVLSQRHAPWVAGQASARLAARLGARVYLTLGVASSIAFVRVHLRDATRGDRLVSTGGANLRGAIGLAFRLGGSRRDDAR
jgi:hypothetical protein